MVGVEPAILQQGAGAPGYPLVLYKVDLKARFVPAIKPLRVQVGIRAEQDCPPLGTGIDREHDTQMAPKMDVVEDLMIENNAVVFALYPFKA